MKTEIQNLREPLIDLRSVENDSNNIRYIANQTEDLQLMAVNNFPPSIEFIKEPCELAQLLAIDYDPHLLKHFATKATPKVRMEAIEKDYKVIQYLEDSTLEEQMKAVDSDYDADDFIKDIKQKAILHWFAKWYKPIF